MPFSEDQHCGATAQTPYTPGGIIPSVMFKGVPKDRFAREPRPFQTGFQASLKRADGFKKPVRRKFQQSAIAFGLTPTIEAKYHV
jgi:hypothetical protein